MKELDVGHKYELENFEDKTKNQTLYFINKEKREDKFITVYDGTSNEEVLKMLINRMYFLNCLCSCKENSIVITKLEESLMWLDKRTKDRIQRQVEGTPND
jgi:hypothetical protein